eukprot:817906-Prymnesium_polylepis.1
MQRVRRCEAFASTGRRYNQCKECGVVSAYASTAGCAAHAKTCGGVSICKHRRQRHNCKQCG